MLLALLVALVRTAQAAVDDAQAAVDDAQAAADDAAAQPRSGTVLPRFSTRTTAEAPQRPDSLPDDASLQRAGTVIGTITIKPLDVFDTSIPEENTTLFRLANTLHINTRPTTIERQLLFEAGEVYDPRLLRETERLLRQTRYLREAWVTPVALQDGKVDLEVTTRDVWTLNPGISFGRKGGKST